MVVDRQGVVYASSPTDGVRSADDTVLRRAGHGATHFEPVPAVGGLEVVEHRTHPATPGIRHDYAGGDEGDLTDSGASGGDSLDGSRVSAEGSGVLVGAAPNTRGELVGALERTLGALSVGRLDLARDEMEALLSALRGGRL